MELRLNIQESSIRKKRGTSFFDKQRMQDFDQIDETSPHDLEKLMDHQRFIRREDAGPEPMSSLNLNSAV